MLSFPVFVSQNPRLAARFFEFCPVSPFLATLTRNVQANLSVCHSYKKHPGWGALRLPLVTSGQSPITKSFTTLRLRAVLARRIRTCEKRASNFFGIRSSKTRHLKSFRIRTYEKGPGEGVLLLTSYPTSTDI